MSTLCDRLLVSEEIPEIMGLSRGVFLLLLTFGKLYDKM